MFSWTPSSLPLRYSEKKYLGIDVIGMVKQLRQRYEYNGRLLNLRNLFQAIPNKKHGGIICSVIVKNNIGIICKIVFLRNRNCKRDYLAILSTYISLEDC